MRTVCAASIRRQLVREGKRWGLSPVDSRGGVAVSQRETVWKQSAPGVIATTGRSLPICNVDMAHPFSNVLRHRRRRWEFNRMRIIREAAARRRADEKRMVDDMTKTYRTDLLRATRELGTDAFLSALREVTRGRANAH